MHNGQLVPLLFFAQYLKQTAVNSAGRWHLSFKCICMSYCGASMRKTQRPDSQPLREAFKSLLIPRVALACMRVRTRDLNLMKCFSVWVLVAEGKQWPADSQPPCVRGQTSQWAFRLTIHDQLLISDRQTSLHRSAWRKIFKEIAPCTRCVSYNTTVVKPAGPNALWRPNGPQSCLSALYCPPIAFLSHCKRHAI